MPLPGLRGVLFCAAGSIGTPVHPEQRRARDLPPPPGRLALAAPASCRLPRKTNPAKLSFLIPLVGRTFSCTGAALLRPNSARSSPQRETPQPRIPAALNAPGLLATMTVIATPPKIKQTCHYEGIRRGCPKTSTAATTPKSAAETVFPETSGTSHAFSYRGN